MHGVAERYVRPAEGLDADDPAVLAALDLVRLELALLGMPSSASAELCCDDL
jgi:hypothetical protein